MRKIVYFFIMCFLVLAPDGAMALMCPEGSNIMDTSNRSSAWAAPTTYTLSGTSKTTVDTYCKNQYGTTCSVSSETASTVQAVACMIFTQSQMSFATNLDNYWCCTNAHSIEVADNANSGGDSGGDSGDDSGETTTITNVVVPCTGTSQQNCVMACQQMFPQVFGVAVARLENCSNIGTVFGTNATYCCMDSVASNIYNLECPSNQYPVNNMTLGGRANYVSATAKTQGGTTYYQMVAQACTCGEYYYDVSGGGYHPVATASAADCALCPCQNAANGTQVCGRTYDPAYVLQSGFWQALASGTLAYKQSDCKIQCSASDGCYDEIGTFKHSGQCNYEI